MRDRKRDNIIFETNREARYEDPSFSSFFGKKTNTGAVRKYVTKINIRFEYPYAKTKFAKTGMSANFDNKKIEPKFNKETKA